MLAALDVLDDRTLTMAQKAGRTASFRQLPTGDGESLWVAPVPRYVDSKLDAAMEAALGLRLENIASFYRLNSGLHDASTRIHCDSHIQGKLPSHAAVFYLDTVEGSGTALYTHPIHGDRDGERLAIFGQDDGQWKAYFKCEEHANTMFIYEADLFHGRYPWKSRGHSRVDGRIVIAKFMRKVNTGTR